MVCRAKPTCHEKTACGSGAIKSGLGLVGLRMKCDFPENQEGHRSYLTRVLVAQRKFKFEAVGKKEE